MHVSPFRLSDKSEDDIAQQFVGRTGIPSETVDIQERARLSPASLNIEGPPDVEFDDVQSLQKFWPRLGWLVGLLLFQSVSSFILRRFEGMIQHHTAVVLFLTMLVGAGGNAGGQSVVLGVRGLALGNIVIGQNACACPRLLTCSVVCGGANKHRDIHGRRALHRGSHPRNAVRP
ncbi:MAG: hypothetical protein KVP17_003071 [Porospora cf. gigantea B]|uniref:uncharacterized protein n=1 Tax=Porospora cf. gigantea B TaxID=2853592 RepID=UPI003571C4CA|nr:MAG: hypothetical protein KVP17_003071 [Porospora cf. gigantea B]